MKVKLIAHTKLSDEYVKTLYEPAFKAYEAGLMTDGQAVSLVAIRSCYSHLSPIDIINAEFEKYFGRPATDGQGGTDADRLIRHIVNSGHLSTMEHLQFTFTIAGISRATLAQLTRHRIGHGYSVQSQRYCKFGSNDKSGGAGYVIPPSIQANPDALDIFEGFHQAMQSAYDDLRKLGIPAEDARFVLTNAVKTNLTYSCNLRALFDFYSKRNQSTHSQWEIAELAEALRREVTKVEPWLEPFFEKLKGVHK